MQEAEQRNRHEQQQLRRELERIDERRRVTASYAAKPWDGADTLEWTLSSPPPFHQFETLPRIK